MSVEWYTPAYIVDAARRTMGGIDLDPASCEEANRTVKAERFYTIAQDGLLLPWSGRVWLNPPFGTQDSKRFAGKLCDSYEKGEVEQGLVLLPFFGGGSAYVAEMSGRYAICIPRDAVAFKSPGNVKGNKSRYPIIVIYLGLNIEQFADCFKSIGACCRPIRPYTPQPSLP